jgi:transcriptional regulator with XRE-family HTH domain
LTPFGEKIRELRAARRITLKEMAEAVGVSPPYLSALEHGHRGSPSWYLVQRIITYFNVIWDEAEELERLAQISHPRTILDASGMPVEATEFANRLARFFPELTKSEIAMLQTTLDHIIQARSLKG